MTEQQTHKAMATKVILPTRGLLYDGLIPGGEVTLTPMTTREEEVLSSAGGKPLAKIQMMIDQCVTLPDACNEIIPGSNPPKKRFTLMDLTVADRFYLLIGIRILSFGGTYKFRHKCGDCKAKFWHELELGELDYKDFDEGADVVEPFQIALPHCGALVDFRLLRGKDEIAVDKYADRELKRGPTHGKNPAYTYQLARHIVRINGDDVDILAAKRFVEAPLVSGDSLALSNAVQKADCGYNLDLEFDCPKCDEMILTPMPWSAEFFRPTA